MAGNGRLSLRLVALGVALIFGGEAFCILGPLRYESFVHVACHIALYSGMVLTLIGASFSSAPFIVEGNQKARPPTGSTELGPRRR